MMKMLDVVMVDAPNLPDLWFQAVYKVLEHGNRFTVDKGSYAGSTRLEFDYFIGRVRDPSYGSGSPVILPDIPSHFNIPNPAEFGYVYGGPGYERSYVEYVMTGTKVGNESYTYGERLRNFKLTNEIRYWYTEGYDQIIDYAIAKNIVTEKHGEYFVDQIEWIIHCYKTKGFRNNQMVLQVAKPDDILLQDPPCLRSIDTRIQDGKLHFVIYFRSWDLWGGLPANLAGIEVLQQYMAAEIGVQQGEFIVESKGLHLYAYAEDLARIRCMKNGLNDCLTKEG